MVNFEHISVQHEGHFQLPFTCSNSSMETIEYCAIICLRLLIKTLEDVIDIVLVSLLLTLIMFH